MQPTNLIPSFTGVVRFKPILLTLALLLLTHMGHAATRIWSGGHASSANWNLRDNWGGIAVPASGDTLVFPSGAARIVNTNNLAGLRLDSILFNGLGGGYNLRGNGIILTNGVSATADAANTVNLQSLTLAQEQTFNVSSGGLLTVNSDIALNGFNLILLTFGDMTMAGAISGRGNLLKAGAGLLTFSGPDDNTYDGSFTVNGGTLAMNKRETISIIPLVFASRIAVPGALAVRGVSVPASARLNFDDQIANTATVTVMENATLELNGNHEALDHLVLNGGTVTMGVGTLILNGDVTAHASTNTATLSGQLFLNANSVFTVADGAPNIDLDLPANVGGAGFASLTKAGPGTLRLGGTNAYLGPTLVGEGLVRVGHDFALGAANNGTTIAAGAELLIETSVNTLREPLTIAGAGLGGASGAIRIGSGATIATNVVLSAPATIHTMGGGNLTTEGVVSGTGPLTKIGPGTLTLAGSSANTFSGHLLAREGLLLLSKLSGSAVQGDLVIGTTNTSATARHTRSANLGGAVTVNAESLYDLDGNNESIDALTLNGGGDVQTGTGQLTLDGDVVVSVHPGPVLAASHVRGRLHVGTGERHFIVEDEFNGDGGLGGVGDLNELIIEARVAGSANLIKSGPGDLILTASNSFTGTLTVEDGELYITDGHGLGATSGQTILTGQASLIVFGTYDYEANGTGIVVDEPLFMNTTGQANGSGLYSFGSNVWSGSIFLAQNTSVKVYTNHVLHLAGAINGLAGLTKVGPGLLLYSGTSSNTYLGTTRVNEGTLRLERTGSPDRSIPGALIVGDGLGGPDADVVEVAGGETQISNSAAVVVNVSGLLVISDNLWAEGIGSLSGSGRVELAGGFGGSSQVGLNGDSTVFEGVISGSGRLWKHGAGTFTLNGANTYTGDTEITQGTLVINGVQPDSDVYVSPGATLSGRGRMGDVTIQGTFAPGDPLGAAPFGGPVVDDANFEPGSTYAVQLNGPIPVGGYDTFYTDDVDLTGATLNVSLGYAPAAGQRFYIVRAFGTTGTFVGLPEGSQIVLNHIPLRISYHDDADGGGDPDVSLTVGDLPLRLGSTRVEAGNGNGRIEPDECNNLFVAIENSSGAAVNVVSAHLHSIDSRIAVTQAESQYGVVPAMGFRTNRTAFQLRTSPTYPCGENARFQLVMETAAHGHFAIPITLPTGSPGAFHAFPSLAGPALIPEAGGLSSQLPVGDGFLIGKARVSLQATHPSAGQLRFRIIAPSGKEVLLSANEGGVGNDYGESCSRRTTFDDDALVNITAAAAPFAGTFAPEGNLADFIGEQSGGIWTLLAEDTVAGGLGALQCWSLELAPAECTDGGGGCESCLAAVAGTLDPTSRTMTQRLHRTSRASGCGDAQPCPGYPQFNVGPHRYNTHSFTNTGPDACVTVVLSVPCATNSLLMPSAYLGDFNPADLCANFLGYSGDHIENGAMGFSVRVPAGQRFTVVVNELYFGGPTHGCTNYTLQLYGLPCPQAAPTLHIASDAGPDNVRLHWSTAYPGFQLQGTPSLGGVALFAFTNVATAPVVIGGNYSVTNNHSRTNHGFFRLRKPGWAAEE